MQSLGAVETIAEGDEHCCISSPNGRPGWAGLPKRVLYLYQAPRPDPAHYHQGSSGPRWPGWEVRGEGEERGREGGRE